MFPRVYRIVKDSSLIVLEDQFEYSFPTSVASGKVLTVEVESDVGSLRYQSLQRYDVVPYATPTLVLLDLYTPPAGVTFRIVVADRLTDFVDASSTYTGPAGTEELPILYAMGLATARPLDDRMAYSRYAVSQQSAPGPGDIMQASQFWFAQFELLLDRLAMPYPVSRN
jgi:hypothetical protein